MGPHPHHKQLKGLVDPVGIITINVPIKYEVINYAAEDNTPL